MYHRVIRYIKVFKYKINSQPVAWWVIKTIGVPHLFFYTEFPEHQLCKNLMFHIPVAQEYRHPTGRLAQKEIYPFPMLALENLVQLFSFTSHSYTLVYKHLASQVSLHPTQTLSPFLRAQGWLTELDTQIFDNKFQQFEIHQVPKHSSLNGHTSVTRGKRKCVL